MITAMAAATVWFGPLSATAATVPYTEDFASDASGWVDGGYSPASWHPSGGPDGGSFVSTQFNFLDFAAPFSPAQFRGESSLGASGSHFDGDWSTAGVDLFTVRVRHDAPFPVNWFVRFAGPSNFPGAVAIAFIPVVPNTWTEISFAIEPANPAFVSFEGSDFASVFTDVGRIHVGVDVNDTLRSLDQDILFSIDQPTIAPEPAGATSLVAGLALLLTRRRQPRRTVHESQ